MAERAAGEGSRVENFSDLPLVDFEHLNALAGGWDEEMTQILEEFLNSVDRELQTLKSISTEPEKACLIAHRLKGSSGNFGFVHLHSLLSQLEERAKQGAITAEEISKAQRIFEDSRLALNQYLSSLGLRK